MKRSISKASCLAVAFLMLASIYSPTANTTQALDLNPRSYKELSDNTKSAALEEKRQKLCVNLNQQFLNCDLIKQEYPNDFRLIISGSNLNFEFWELKTVTAREAVKKIIQKFLDDSEFSTATIDFYEKRVEIVTPTYGSSHFEGLIESFRIKRQP